MVAHPERRVFWRHQESTTRRLFRILWRCIRVVMVAAAAVGPAPPPPPLPIPPPIEEQASGSKLKTARRR
jgi:hypothetical protein